MQRIAVIGGGIVGASAAYRLARRGAEVCWLDRGDAGQATAAGAGILPPDAHFASNAELAPLTARARAHYAELARALAEDGETDTGYHVCGALHVALSTDDRARLEHVRDEAERLANAGVPHVGVAQLVDGDRARALFPALGAEVIGALHTTGAARVDGRRLLAALTRACARRGVERASGDARLWTRAGVVRGVEVASRCVEADAVIVAAGAWSRSLAEAVGLTLPIAPQRGQLAHLALVGTRTADWPIVLGLGLGAHYLLTFPHDRVVVGATRESDAGFDHRVTAAGVTQVLQAALRVAPGLASASVQELRVGFRPLSADGKPVLGGSRRVERLLFATGHGGFGLELGPYSGALVADAALGDEPALDLAPFSIDRFESGRPCADARAQ